MCPCVPVLRELRLLQFPVRVCFFDRVRMIVDCCDVQVITNCSAEQRNIARQAYAGLLWSKQFYHYVIKDWLNGDKDQPPPPDERKRGRNVEWGHLFNRDIISMPDKWEYPWVRHSQNLSFRLHRAVQPRVQPTAECILKEESLSKVTSISWLVSVLSVRKLGSCISHDSVRQHRHQLCQRTTHSFPQGMVHASKWTGDENKDRQIHKPFFLEHFALGMFF